jgi:hypothetical protein
VAASPMMTNGLKRVECSSKNSFVIIPLAQVKVDPSGKFKLVCIFILIARTGHESG